ncbi:MAG: BREX-1 system phosphatase PglZ type B [Bacillota bacterium]|nr:BREX-1 system phosphatase PglZ type B [Bacillota bacterium]
MKVVDHLIKAIRSAAVYNPEVQVEPVCILWSDRDRQWEAVIPRLQVQMPELLSLGAYDPDQRSGPAIWLRCVIEGKAPGSELPAGVVPVIYLPGVSRQDLRAVESCPDYLKPLAELQYRGVIWSQYNGKDWSIFAYLKSGQGGLNFDVASDQGTKNSMLLALGPLLDEKVDLLKGKHLDRNYFNELVTGGDTVRDLLQWIDQGDAYKEELNKNQWQAFVDVCKSQFGFNPDKEGILAAAERLANHEGPWHVVWKRFCEAPARYPNIPKQIWKCKAPEDNILWRTGEGYEGWPQWNEEKENELRSELALLKDRTPQEARSTIKELERNHAKRRKLVWAELGYAPLALLLGYLAVLAEATANSLAGGSVDDFAVGYRSGGWQADDAVIRALEYVNSQKDQEAAFAAIRAIYIPWLDETARNLQRTVAQNSYPGAMEMSSKTNSHNSGCCIVFVDGMRFDLARRLSESLKEIGCQVEEKLFWSALPSVTATGKPAVTPVKDKITGQEINTDFEPCIAETNQSLKGGQQLKKLLENEGWSVLEGAENAENAEKAWFESGNIDHAGHKQGWKMTKQVDSLLQEIKDNIYSLIEGGWTDIRVVTDHGWLLLPGGLPKINLPTFLAENKWGRCAVLKEGAVTDEHLYPWYWNPDIHFALADGISCYRKGLEYSHGGLSLQECLTLQLAVKPGKMIERRAIEVTDLGWKGLRCTVIVDGNFEGLSLDIRTHAGNPESSVVSKVKELKADGTASVVVDNTDLEGETAFVVLLDEDGELADQFETVIGGGES